MVLEVAHDTPDEKVTSPKTAPRNTCINAYLFVIESDLAIIACCGAQNCNVRLEIVLRVFSWKLLKLNHSHLFPSSSPISYNILLVTYVRVPRKKSLS